MYQKKSKTIQETALEGVPEFGILVNKLTQSFAINGKATSILNKTYAAFLILLFIIKSVQNSLMKSR